MTLTFDTHSTSLTHLVVLPYRMLLTKFQGHGSTGSGEDFLRFLPYMGMVAMLVM